MTDKVRSASQLPYLYRDSNEKAEETSKAVLGPEARRRRVGQLPSSGLAQSWCLGPFEYNLREVLILTHKQKSYMG
jgi:hypothetical protein